MKNLVLFHRFVLKILSGNKVGITDNLTQYTSNTSFAGEGDTNRTDKNAFMERKKMDKQKESKTK